MTVTPPQTPPGTRPMLRGMTHAELESLMEQAGEPRFRGRQLYQWLYQKDATAFDEMSNLSKPLRAWLAEHAELGALERLSLLGEPGRTQKAAFRLGDGQVVESVVMREADDAPGQVSLCLSSQVGCALGCTFCMTGWGGFRRNLTPGEIVGQLLELRRAALGPGESITHIVMMGMGEPLHNLGGLVPALRLMTDPEGIGISKRRVTVSTAGVVPGIAQLGAAALGIGLAISLNATTDTVREQIMPINRKWPIADLLGAIDRYPLEPRRRITVEYVLLRGVNDTMDDARRLVELLRGRPVKVNLIMFNATNELEFEPVSEDHLERFAAVLSRAHMTVTVRRSKGREIEAACGQLAAHAREAAS